MGREQTWSRKAKKGGDLERVPPVMVNRRVAEISQNREEVCPRSREAAETFLARDKQKGSLFFEEQEPRDREDRRFLL